LTAVASRLLPSLQATRSSSPDQHFAASGLAHSLSLLPFQGSQVDLGQIEKPVILFVIDSKGR